MDDRIQPRTFALGCIVCHPDASWLGGSPPLIKVMIIC